MARNQQAGQEPEVDQDLFPSAEDMQEANNIWAGGQEEAARSRPVGQHTAVIEDALLGRSSGSGRLQIHYHLKILSGSFKDVELDKYDGLGSPAQAAITQQQLKKLGIDPAQVSVKTLPAHLLNVKGKKMVINGKINGDFFNISFVKEVNDSLTEAPAARAGAPAARRTAPAGRRY